MEDKKSVEDSVPSGSERSHWIGRLLRNTNSLTTAGSAYMMQPREEMIPNISPRDRGNPVN